MPAFAAGVPDLHSLDQRAFLDRQVEARERAVDRDRLDAEIGFRGRSPPFSSVLSSALAVLIGIAKPMPMLPSVPRRSRSAS